MNPESSTMPYDNSLNVFSEEYKEIFEIIKSSTPRILKQYLATKNKLTLEGYYYQRYTPLMEAVYLQNLEMVEFICKEIKNKYTHNGVTSYKYIRYLNQVNIEGKTALIIAVLSNGSTPIIQYLIKEGANLFVKDRQNNDIFEYANCSLTEEVENYILSLKKD